METTILSPLSEHSITTREPEKTQRSLSLADYSVRDFVKCDNDLPGRTRFRTEQNGSYTEPDFITEMWQTRRGATARLKSLSELFRKRKYARFTNEINEDSKTTLERDSASERSKMQSFHGKVGPGYQSTADSAAQTESNPKVKIRTKIFTRRSQRSQRETDTEDFTDGQASSSMFNDFNQVEAWLSFAAHVRRQSPGFSASCTQTLRMHDFASVNDFFESEVQSNVTFNPLFEDDDSDHDLPRRYTRHRLYTIDEESEVFDSGS